MAYDQELADRVRVLLAPEGPADERRMFGGLAFMVAGHMAVAAAGDGGLMVRVGPDQAGPLSEGAAHVAPMVMGRRTSRSWVHVDDAALADDDALTVWVRRGVASVRDLPPR